MDRVDRTRNRQDKTRDPHLDTRHTHGDVHGGDTGEVERLEGHLGAGLTDTLCGEGPNGTACCDYEGGESLERERERVCVCV